MSESEGTETSESSSDEEPADETLDKHFFKTLSYLKDKNQIIYDEKVKFFNEDKKHKQKEKQNELSLREFKVKVLVERSDNKHKDEEVEPLPYNEEQNHLKNSFKRILEEDDSDEDDLLIKKVKTEKEQEEEEAEYINWLKGKKNEIDNKEEEKDLKPLRDFWNNPNLDTKEEFLRDYILNKRWKEEDEVIHSDISLDGELLEKQDDFEREYNFRNEGGNELIKRYPRVIEGSVRRKDESRKLKRKTISERKKEKKQKKKLEIKKEQKQKLQELKERLEMLKEATGNESFGVDTDLIESDFDPEEHDKMMAEMYGEEFYSNTNDKGNSDIDDDQLQNDASTKKLSRSKLKKQRKKKKGKKDSDLTEIISSKDEQFKEMAGEYYSIGCEDFIDDIPCRFKYSEVEPNDYGLTIEEILAADDEDLNRWVPTSKLRKIKPAHAEKSEAKMYRKKANNLELKAKLLPSLFKTEEGEEQDEKLFKGEEIEKDKKRLKNHEEEEKVEKDMKFEVEKLSTNNEDISSNNQEEYQNISNNKKKEAKNITNNEVNKKDGKKQKQFKKRKDKKLVKILNEISDDRLKAYDIKPKKFRSKLLYSK